MRTASATFTALRIVATALVLSVVLFFVLSHLIDALFPAQGARLEHVKRPILLGVSFLLGPAVVALFTTRYRQFKPGENPVAVANVLVAYGKSRAAVRYLLSVPQDHSSSVDARKRLSELQRGA